MIDVERLTRAIASSMCRTGYDYIDIASQDGWRYLEGNGDDELPFIAQAIAREYELDEPPTREEDE